MPSQALDKLGEFLVKAVRDEAIEKIRMILAGQMKGEDARHIQQTIEPLTTEQREAMIAITPEIVDQVLHQLLLSIEEHSDIALVIESGASSVRATDESDGLAGELYGARGWIRRFGKF